MSLLLLVWTWNFPNYMITFQTHSRKMFNDCIQIKIINPAFIIYLNVNLQIIILCLYIIDQSHDLDYCSIIL